MRERPRLRIGELGHRVGLSPDVLRVWERRYGLLQPERSAGGYRLYSDRDERRVRLVQERVRAGLSPAEATREVMQLERDGEMPGGEVPTTGELTDDLSRALDAFDEDGAHEVLDRLLGLHGLEIVIRDALMPYLRNLGERWARREITIAQEHFASRFLEGRLLALARGWNKGPGRRAVLACPSGEQHTLPLVCFGLMLRSRGWRNIYLGADTPPSTVQMAADTVSADVIVLSAASPDRFAHLALELTALARRQPLLLAGGGATAEVAHRLGLERLTDDPSTAAETLSRRYLAARRPQPPAAKT